MDAMPDALSEMLKGPGAFALRCLKAFRANQGLLLAGAVAYYALLSIVPLLILVLIVLSHWLDRALLLDTLERYLGWRSEEHTSELQSLRHLVCRLLLEKKKKKIESG